MTKLLAITVLIASLIATPAHALTQEQQDMVRQGKEMVARTLKDPASAQWRDLYIRGITLCGEVNAKNAYGGYVGFRRFYVAPIVPGFSGIADADAGAPVLDAFRQMCDSQSGPRVDIPPS